MRRGLVSFFDNQLEMPMFGIAEHVAVMFRRRFRPNRAYAAAAPSAQAAVALGGRWHTRFPDTIGVDTGGYAALCEDERATWGLARLGGVAGADVLELGPLEGGHTFMLDRAGAKSVTAIEAHKGAYLRCLIAKEVLDIKSARFLLGDFASYLRETPRHFDLIWASGVLYHMAEPLELLQLLSERTDRLFIWTHFFEDEGDPPHPVRRRAVEFHGATTTQFERPYLQTGHWRFNGGVYSGRAWLRRSDILKALALLGYDRIEIGCEIHEVTPGPSFALAATRLKP